MSVAKVIEVMADSPTSWEDATKIAVKEAGKSVKNIKSVWVKDMSAVVSSDNITSYRVCVKISFEVNR